MPYDYVLWNTVLVKRSVGFLRKLYKEIIESYNLIIWTDVVFKTGQKNYTYLCGVE